MMKTSKSARSFFALVLTVVLALSMFVPVIAENTAASSPYTITIEPNSNTLVPTYDEDAYSTLEGNYGPDSLVKRFNAYAIFTGELDDAYAPGTGMNTLPKPNQLANIKWGKGINEEKYSDLLLALTKITITLAKAGENNLGVKTTGDPTGIQQLAEDYDTTTGDNANNGLDNFAVTAETTLGEMVEQALTLAGYTVESSGVTGSADDSDLSKSAVVIAGVIADINAVSANTNNSVLAREFAKVVGARTGITASSAGTYTYLSDTYTQSEWDSAHVNGTTGVANGAWTITALNDAGYYLIVDTYNAGNPATTTEADEVSDYILAVFGSQVVRIKSNAVGVDKDILDEEGNTVKGDTAGIGDSVKFRLTGTLPENYANYAMFKYIFKDTMSEGLTFDEDSLKVYAQIGNEKYEITTGFTTEPATLNSANVTANGNQFTVSFANMKEDGTGTVTNQVNGYKLDADGERTGSEISLTELIKNSSVITVEYSATVNANAVVDDPSVDGALSSNKNEVKIEYSNDVNDSSSTAETTKEVVYVYVIGLDIDKVDGTEADNTKNALSGAGFALTKVSLTETGDTTYYAVFTLKEDETNDGDTNYTKTFTYTIAGWISQTQLDAMTAWPGTDGNWLTGVDADTLNAATSDNPEFAEGTYYLAVKTVNTDGSGDSADVPKESLYIKGLDAGTYTLIEKVTPSGYDTMDDITFTISATINKDNTDTIPDGALTGLDAAVEGTRDDVTINNDAATIISGNIPIKLANMPSGYLPGTGGIGTALFYICGGVLLAAAAILLIAMNVKKEEKNTSEA